MERFFCEGHSLTRFLFVQYTKALRLFKEDPKWTPLKRGEETDSNPYRKDYLQTTTSNA
jgi:cupin superfamily acireductone dioxygenase involved in methionine salvage